MKQFCIRGTAQGTKKDSTVTGMLEYYQRKGVRLDNLEASLRKGFDPVARKYGLGQIVTGILNEAAKLPHDDDQRSAYWKQYHIQLEEIEKLKGDELRTFVYEQVYGYLQAYEDSRELVSLTKKDITHVMENLYMIYNTEDEKIRQVVQLISLISQNVISKYIQIDGLERLFHEQYIDFEWEMHLGMDHKQLTMKFYRDHFIHQARDAYMMDRLLRDGGFYKRVLDALNRPDISKVSRYFHKMVERQREVPLPNQALLRHDEDFVPRNIIYMSAYMAGLFHDIGYPTTYFQSLRRRISAFTPSMNPGNPTQDTLPGDIFSLLQNSLLFRLVPFEEIQTRVYKDSIDHGTLSAIAFLLHFYENGVIFQLPPYQAAAVELAGLAIYNHTYVYSVSETGKKGADDYRPRFMANPISYLLRLCDDLQEWDRVYFEISSYSNLITCSRCHTPIVGQRHGKENLRHHRYVCNCCSKDQIGAFSRTFDGELSFPYRRLYNIEVCDEVKVESITEDNLDNTKDICFRLHYNPYKLLHIVYISPSYARYRIGKLNSLKSLMLYQSGLPHMWLDYVVTANPIFLKTYLLEEYFEALLESNQEKTDKIEGYIQALKEPENRGDALEEAVNLLMEQLEPVLDKLWEGNQVGGKLDPDKENYIKRKIDRALRLYCMLYLYGQMFRHGPERPVAPTEWVADEIYQRYCAPNRSDRNEVFQCLLGDCMLQLSRLYTNEQLRRLTYIPDAYMQQFAPGNWKKMLPGLTAEYCSQEFYGYALEQYVDQQEYRPACWKMSKDKDLTADESGTVDAFTDLGFFQALYEVSVFGPETSAD